MICIEICLKTFALKEIFKKETELKIFPYWAKGVLIFHRKKHTLSCSWRPLSMLGTPLILKNPTC